MKKAPIITLCIFTLITAKFAIGVYEPDGLTGHRIFLKHRPIWRTFFHSPRSVGDMRLEEMSVEQRHEQRLFDEFVLANNEID